MTSTSEAVIACLEQLAEQAKSGGEPAVVGPPPHAIPVIVAYEHGAAGQWVWEVALEVPRPGQDIERSAPALAQLLDDIPTAALRYCCRPSAASLSKSIY
jgi:hypothetical protein